MNILISSILLILLMSCGQESADEYGYIGHTFRYTHFKNVSDSNWSEVQGVREVYFYEDESFAKEIFKSYRDTSLSPLCSGLYNWVLDESEGELYFQTLEEESQENDDYDIFSPYVLDDGTVGDSDSDTGPFRYVYFLEDNDTNYTCDLYPNYELPVSLILTGVNSAEVFEPNRSLFFKLKRIK